MTETDFSGAPPQLLRRVLEAYGVDETVAFFREIGVALHEEDHGKLFPDANRSRVVLQALLDEAARRGVLLPAGERVEAVDAAAGGGFVLRTTREQLAAAQVVLATGGLSLPKTGSDGHGLRMAEGLATPWCRQRRPSFPSFSPARSTCRCRPSASWGWTRTSAPTSTRSARRPRTSYGPSRAYRPVTSPDPTVRRPPSPAPTVS